MGWLNDSARNLEQTIKRYLKKQQPLYLLEERRTPHAIQTSNNGNEIDSKFQKHMHET